MVLAKEVVTGNVVGLVCLQNPGERVKMVDSGEGAGR
jgi:hypothetical protein